LRAAERKRHAVRDDLRAALAQPLDCARHRLGRDVFGDDLYKT
jgi:hypothetical protein